MAKLDTPDVQISGTILTIINVIGANFFEIKIQQNPSLGDPFIVRTNKLGDMTEVDLIDHPLSFEVEHDRKYRVLVTAKTDKDSKNGDNSDPWIGDISFDKPTSRELNSVHSQAQIKQIRQDLSALVQSEKDRLQANQEVLKRLQGATLPSPAQPSIDPASASNPTAADPTATAAPVPPSSAAATKAKRKTVTPAALSVPPTASASTATAGTAGTGNPPPATPTTSANSGQQTSSKVLSVLMWILSTILGIILLYVLIVFLLIPAWNYLTGTIKQSDKALLSKVDDSIEEEISLPAPGEYKPGKLIFPRGGVNTIGSNNIVINSAGPVHFNATGRALGEEVAWANVPASKVLEIPGPISDPCVKEATVVGGDLMPGEVWELKVTRFWDVKPLFPRSQVETAIENLPADRRIGVTGKTIKIRAKPDNKEAVKVRWLATRLQ